MEVNCLVDLYDEWADNYGDLVRDVNYSVPNWLESHQDLMPNRSLRVLDLGCANGYIANFIRSYRPYTFTGIDFSKEMVKVSQQSGLYEQVIQADLSQGLPVEVTNKQFDIILALGTLEFISNHEQLFAQLKKVLAPQGQIWFTVEAKNKYSRAMYLDTHLVNYDKNDIAVLVKEAGFKVSLCTQDIGYHPTSHNKPVYYFLVMVEHTVGPELANLKNSTFRSKDVCLYKYM